MKKSFLLGVLALTICFTSTAQLVYKDVAKIFFDRCSSCHHTGTAAPFSLTAYEPAVTWSQSIKDALLSNEMPPWLPDTSYTRFAHENIISADEKAAIIDWIDAGSLPGDTTLAPPAPFYNAGYVLKGTPDLIVQIPPYTSIATTSDKYVCISVPTGLTENRYIRAFEIVPGKAEIVHHAILMIDSNGTTTSDYSGGCYQPTGDYRLGGWAPGSPPSVFPNAPELKTGIWIKAGSKIVFQLHYPEGSAGTVDSTQLRIYLYPVNEPNIRPMQSSTPLQNWLLAIPPYVSLNFTAEYPKNNTIDVPWSIFATFPHSHLIAKNIINYAYNGSDTIPLIHIPEWDFHWQGEYVFRKLVPIPAGYKLYSKHLFDNTASNPHNPNNPPKLVIAGPNTNNEMLFDSFQWLYYLPGDENIDIETLLANDPLLTGIEPSKAQPQSLIARSSAYPNPFNNKVEINYELTEAANTIVTIYTLHGKKVVELLNKVEEKGNHTVAWEQGVNSSAAPGVYFYTITAGKHTESGKLMLLPN